MVGNVIFFISSVKCGYCATLKRSWESKFVPALLEVDKTTRIYESDVDKIISDGYPKAIKYFGSKFTTGWKPLILLIPGDVYDKMSSMSEPSYDDELRGIIVLNSSFTAQESRLYYSPEGKYALDPVQFATWYRTSLQDEVFINRMNMKDIFEAKFKGKISKKSKSKSKDKDKEVEVKETDKKHKKKDGDDKKKDDKKKDSDDKKKTLTICGGGHILPSSLKK